MMLLGFAALGLLAGLISGGSLRGLGRYALKGALLPVAAYLVKAAAAALFIPQTGAIAVCLVQYSLLFLFILRNHRRPVWPLFAFAGSMMNFLVIVLNGGCMPVAKTLLDGAERLVQLAQNQIYAYCLMGEGTQLPILGDIIRLGKAGQTLGFASIGDVVLCIGVGILFWQMTRTGMEKRKTAEPTQD
jgi:hypothetical protein